MKLELVLINGERRSLVLSQHPGSIVAALDRLDEWIQTDDGGWVQKQHIVEVRATDPGVARGSDEELRQLRGAADRLAEQADE